MNRVPQSENSVLQSILPSPAAIHHKPLVRTNLEPDSVFGSGQLWSIPRGCDLKEAENATQSRKWTHRDEFQANNPMKRNVPVRGSNTLHATPIPPLSPNALRFPLKSLPPTVSEVQSPKYPETAAISASLISIYQTSLPFPTSPSPTFTHPTPPTTHRANRNKSSVDTFKVK